MKLRCAASAIEMKYLRWTWRSAERAMLTCGELNISGSPSWPGLQLCCTGDGAWTSFIHP